MSVALELFRAARDGRRAAEAGAARSTCPHSAAPDAPARERMLFTAWQDGYDAVRPFPIDYGEE